MKVSVIIPYGGGENYLRDCLDSVAEQKFTDYEVLLIVDGVTEEVSWIEAEYGNRFDLKLLTLKGKNGVAAARNMGLDYAQGEYVFFLDSDDYIYGENFEEMFAQKQTDSTEGITGEGELFDSDEDDEGDDDSNENLTEGSQNASSRGSNVSGVPVQTGSLSGAEAEAVPDPEVIYGKKYSTWYKRKIYLPIFDEKMEEKNRLKEERAAERAAELEKLAAKEAKRLEKLAAKEAKRLEKEARKAAQKAMEEADFEGENESDEDTEANEKKIPRRAYRKIWGIKKLFGSVSVLNIMFKRSFLEENNIRFNEEFTYYSDSPFILSVLDKGQYFKKAYSAIYLKRKHNDPVNQPALSQVKDENRFAEMIRAYYYMREITEEGSYARQCLEAKMMTYYVGYFVKKFRRSDNPMWKEERFQTMVEVSQTFSKEAVKKKKFATRRLVKLLQKGNLNKTVKVVNFRMARKKFVRLFKKKHEIAKYLYRHKYLNKPLLENVVMFECFFGKQYADSPKAIFEYMAKNYPDKYKFVWVLENKKIKLPYDAVVVKRFSIKYMFYLARAKYFVFNVRQPDWFKKRDGVVFLETWHGTPLKKLAFDLEEVYGASPAAKKQIYTASKKWDYLIAANEFSSETFKRCYMYEGTMLEYGYPRNDILHSPDKDELAKKVRAKLGIGSEKKTVLYAPTWRDDECYGHGAYKFSLKLDLDRMKERLGDDYVVLLRTHYYIADSIDISSYGDFAVNVCRYDDIAELYLISDIIVTDYSSVFFDYANLKRPMLFYTYDLDKYRDTLRGFYFNIEEGVPGPLLFTTDEVIDSILDIDNVNRKYAEKYSEFYEKFCSWEDGHAAENCVKQVFGVK